MRDVNSGSGLGDWSGHTPESSSGREHSPAWHVPPAPQPQSAAWSAAPAADEPTTQRISPAPIPPGWAAAADAGWPQPPQPAQSWGAAVRGGLPQPGYAPSQGPGAAESAWAGGDGPERRGTLHPASGSADEPVRSRGKLVVATGIGVAGIIGLATVLILHQSGPGAGAHAAAPAPSGFQPTATSPAGAAQQTAAVFLAAWQRGNVQQAASYTDDPADATSVLTAYRTGLNLAGLQLTPQSATAAGLVSFTVSAKVSSTGTVTAASSPGAGTSAAASSTGAATAAGTSTPITGTWTYTSHLRAYQKNGDWYVKWDPTLVAPNVATTVHPVALAIAPGVAKVTDSAGGDLSAGGQGALVNIAGLVKKNTDTGQGTPGLEIALADTAGRVVSGSTSVLTQPVSTAVVATTIDPGVEALASAAVAQFPRSSMVVLRPSTGAILAVANSTGTGDAALTGTLAPGSSMKVVTTTGLLVDGLLPQGINTQVGCPLVEDVQGVKIHNSTSSPNSQSGTEDFEPNTTPFSTDFAQSCNNAFTQWWQQMAGGKLANAASTYYGLNRPWDLGIGSKGTYFTMPSDQSGSELAEELYGQGQIEANPLSMASVAATVDTGSFHQPYLVDGLTDKATATALPSTVRSALYTVMRQVITSGTAAGVGFGPGVYGKTGTAEADANKDHNPNGWMIVFDPAKDLAIAAVVVDSNFGASTAGPEANYVLQHQ